MDYERLGQYALFLFLFALGQSLSMWGQYVTLPYKNLSATEAYKMAIPYAWLDWIAMTYTVNLSHTHKLVTPTQITFLLIIIQFCLILIINAFYLKQPVFRSDIIAFFIILAGFFMSFFSLYTNYVANLNDKQKANSETVKKIDEGQENAVKEDSATGIAKEGMQMRLT